MPNKLESSLEIARAAMQKLDQARLAVQIRQNEIRAAKIEASQVFALAQAGPLVEGAAEAAQQLAAIERDLPEKTVGVDLLQAETDQAQAEARAAGLRLLNDTEGLMDRIAALLRQEILPLVDELDEHRRVLQGCRAPLPGSREGRYDPYQSIPGLLLQIRSSLRELEERRKAGR